MEHADRDLTAAGAKDAGPTQETRTDTAGKGRTDRPKRAQPEDDRPSRTDAPGKDVHVPFSPISDERSIGSMDCLRSGSMVKARTTTVLITARGEYLVYAHEKPPSRTELLRKRARFLSRSTWVTTRLASAVNSPAEATPSAFRQRSTSTGACGIAITVVRDGIRDVRTAVEPRILARLRPITPDFDIQDSEGAELAANQALGRLPEVAHFGLDAVAFVRLGMDRAVRDRVRMETARARYRSIIASGDLEPARPPVGRNPKDVADVIALLIKERDTHRHDTVDFVTKLIDSGAIERWEIEDQILDRVAVAEGHHEQGDHGYRRSPPRIAGHGSHGRADPTGTAHSNGTSP